VKTCIKCGECRGLECFHKDLARSDGLFPYCKLCRKIERKPAHRRPVHEVLSQYKISEGGCWEWAGVLSRDGYGMACYQGKRVRAHRLSLLNHLGVKGSDLLVLHKCDNRRCINPKHLYLGTNAENSKDMVDRGRSSSPYGQLSSNAKITECKAKAILQDARAHKLIAEEFGVAPSTVSAIKTGRRWGHLSI